MLSRNSAALVNSVDSGDVNSAYEIITKNVRMSSIV